MKILKYQKGKSNSYKITTDKKTLMLYDDIILKYGLLLKKEISPSELKKIEEENNILASFYDAMKILNTKMRTEKEIKELLKKKGYQTKEIELTLKKLKTDGYLNNKQYIEAYIHDHLALYLEGENKIKKDLIALGLKEREITPFLEEISPSIYEEKIEKYITKKAKVNKKSVNEFKKKIMIDLINKGFKKEMIAPYLENLELEENKEELEKLIQKLYKKYRKKYDEDTTKLKIKRDLYAKGYHNNNFNE